MQLITAFRSILQGTEINFFVFIRNKKFYAYMNTIKELVKIRYLLKNKEQKVMPP